MNFYNTALRGTKKVISAIIILVGAIVIIALVLVGFVFTLATSYMVVFITSVPAFFGEQLPVESWTKTLLDFVAGIERLHELREEFFYLYLPYLTIEEDVERWSQLQRIDNARRRTETKLKNGEYVITFLLSFLAALFAVFFDVVYAGVILAVLAVILSSFTFIRYAIIDVLSYDSELFVEASTREIALRAAFNAGPLNRSGAILIVILAILHKIHKEKTIQGIRFLERLVADNHAPKETGKWENDNK